MIDIHQMTSSVKQPVT